MSEGPRYECDECGYDLTAVPRDEGAARCPECGQVHEAPPYARAPWPALWRIAATMCIPAGVLVALVVGAAQVATLEPFLWMGWSILLIAWVMFALVLPIWEAGELARRHALRPARRIWRWRLAAAGLAANLTVSAVGVWLLLIL